VYAICLGYEDGIDANHLKNDPAFQHVLDGKSASQPTLSRFKNRVRKSEICMSTFYTFEAVIPFELREVFHCNPSPF